MSKRRHTRPTARRRAPARAQAAANSLYRRALRHEPLEDRRLLAVVTVDTLSDTVDFNDGHTSLREAIFATNLVAGADTINFAPALTANGPATIVLKQGELKLTDSLTIIGRGANLLTIDASGNDPTPNLNNGDGSRIFNIDDGSLDTVHNVSISGLKLTGGDVMGTGGAIRSRENLTVNSSIISGNATSAAAQLPVSYVVGSGGGIFSYRGYLTVSDSSISGNTAAGIGGGLYSKGFGNARNLTVSYSSVAGNTSGSSGGGVASSNCAIANSTISGNSARQDGGGAFGYNVDLTDSTVSGNSAGRDGGGVSGAFGLNLIRSTITNNSAVRSGGGVRADAGATLSHTILAGNMLNGVPHDFTGVMSIGYSLIGVLNGTVSVGDGNIYSSFGAPIDPWLGPLADNGGFLLPDGTRILTHALLPGSPAINAGDLNADAGVNGVPQFDERGTPFTRVFGGRIDIGAFEYQQPSDLNLVVDTLVDEDDGNYGHGDLSLREAIKLANLYPGPNASSVINTIRFDPALTANGPATILLTMGELDITHGVNIIGPGANLLTIDASGSDRSSKAGDGANIFNIAGSNENFPIDASISGLTLTGADANVGGAIIVDFTRLVLTGDTISGNTGMNSGGAIYANKSNVTVNQSTISGNVCTASFGGAIYFVDSSPHNNNRKLQIQDSQISNNKSAFSGGGVAVILGAGEVDIEDSTLSGNSGGGGGGGLFVRAFGLTPIAVTITGSSLDHNASSSDGGGAFLQNVGATIAASRIESNSSAGNGGGILLAGGLASPMAAPNSSIVNSTISGNTSASGGAGIAFSITQGTMALTNDTITNNLATGTSDSQGGGIFAMVRNASATISGTTVSGNSAGSGGGIYAQLISANLSLDGIHVDGNTATALQSSGAGIDLTGSISNATIQNSDIENNSAQGTDSRGGGIFNMVTLSIAGTRISGNTSGRYGGGIYDSAGLQIDTSEISGNSALLTKGIGGGVFRTGTGSFALTNSTVSGNSATLDAGGLYFASSVSNIINTSTITGNLAVRDGGGILALTGLLGLEATTVSSNTAGRDGGGIWKAGVLNVDGSTINNNTAGGNGGGIANFGPANINDTTIAQNAATINGGGIWSNAGQNLQSSTILANRAGQAGGGVFVTAGSTAIYDSIVAGDTGPSGADISGLLGVTLNVHYSLIGNNQGSGLTAAPVGSPDANGNFIGGSTISSMIVPALGLLTMNGGPTATYAPLAGSVVINAGDPTALAGVNGVPVNDQRGVQFPRVYNSRIDMGAVEAQPNPLPGDFNFNGVVDLADYALYRKALTTLDPRADANGDGRIDDADLAVWRANFGNTYSTATANSLAVVPKSEAQTPMKMLSDAAVEPSVGPGVARISLPIPVADSAIRPAPSSSSVVALKVALTLSPPLTLAANSRQAYRPSAAPSRDHERDVVDFLADASGNEATAIDEVFAALGVRKSFVSSW